MNFAMRFFVVLLVAASLWVSMEAQESCNVEAKLLLVPTQVEAAIRGSRVVVGYFGDFSFWGARAS